MAANDRDQIIQYLKQILVDDLFIDVPLEELKEDDSMAEIGLDSVGRLELITIVENKYQISIEDDRDLAENSRSIGVFTDYIIAKINARPAES